MKTLAKWIVAGLAFALGVMAAEHCEANQVRQIRSLNAATVAGVGASFTVPPSGVNPFYVPGGGTTWTVIVNQAGLAQMSWQVEGQMTDGTWVVIAGPYNNTGSGVNQVITFCFRGPWQDMRVNLVTRTAGNLTADIYAEYY
jgi:hypothetical protein